MRAKTKLIAPIEAEPRAEHPHRCTAGHRWQHGGPAATTCRMPSYDPVSGDLPFLPPEDCPLCCGRSDLLVRGLHAHYCNICDGDWQHEGHCLDSLAACCPWCFPKLDSEPVPGARSGPHFHVCSECGQNWRHATGCSAPLRAVLSECPGCRTASPPAECDAPTPAPSPATPSAGARALGARIRPLARPIGIAAVALLSIPLALKGYSMLRGAGADDGARVLEERIVTPSPGPLPSTPAPPPTPAPSPPAPSAPASPAPLPLAPRPDLAKPPARSAPVNRVPPSDSARLPPAPSPAPRREAHRAPVREPATEPRAQLAVETPSRAPEIPPAPSESAPPATPVRAALPSIPGAPPFAGLVGSSGLDTSLDGHPRRAHR